MSKYKSKYLFLLGGMQPLSYTQHRQLMRRISKQMDIKGITGYTFRHTIITDIYEETHDANIAAAMAGYSKTTITMNRYAHARQDAAVKGIKALDKVYSMWYFYDSPLGAAYHEGKFLKSTDL